VAEPIIKDRDKKEIQSVFERLEEPVTLVLFTQEHECQYCRETHQLLEELTALSDKLTLEVYDFVKDKDKAEDYGIDKIPAIVPVGDRDYGIRFFGIPAGYEFATLLEDLVDVSRRDHGLDEEVMAMLEKVDRPVHMQAMITPT